MDFSGGSKGGAGDGKFNEAEFMNLVQGQVELQKLQQYYMTVRDKCFEKCITKPSSSLSSSEQQCLARCCDRYAEATEIVAKAVIEASGL
eukprot:jgi/Botrbrau1/17210/Bobra.0817s0006.1